MKVEQLRRKQYLLARRLGLSGEYEEALVVLNRLIKTYPEYISAVVLKGNILDIWASDDAVDDTKSEQLYEDARACYELALKMDTDCIPAYIDLGDYWKIKNNLQNALESLNIAIELLEAGKQWESREDEIDDAFSRKAAILRELGREDEAAFCLAVGRRLNPTSIMLEKDEK